MKLGSPLTLILCWVAAPLVIVVASAGLGLLLARLAGLRLGVATAPFGFAAGVSLQPALMHCGMSADFASAIVLLLAAGGLALRVLQPADGERPAGEALRSISPEARWAGAAAAVVFALEMLPLVASGRAGVLGYYFLSDPAWHTALIEWLHSNGAHTAAHITDSYSAASQQISLGYPLGVYVWPLISITVTGQSAFALWTPVSALALAMAAAVVFRILRGNGAGPRGAAAVAVFAAAGYVPFAYYAQGGSKEVLFSFSFLLAAMAVAEAPFLHARATWPRARAALPAAVSLSTMIAVFGPGAALWAAPLTVLLAAGWLLAPATTRAEALRGTVTFAGVAAMIAIPSIVAALSSYTIVSNVANLSSALGNLYGRVSPVEALGGWIALDYRAAQPLGAARPWVALLSLTLLALAVKSLVRDFRERLWCLPAAVASAVLAYGWVRLNYNFYFEAKTLVVLAPALAASAGAGVLLLLRAGGRRRTAGRIAASLIAATLVLQLLIGYGRAYISPAGRFEELAALNAKFAGRGPTAIVDQESYSQVLLRDAAPWDSQGLFRPFDGIRPGTGPSDAVAMDADSLDDAISARTPLVLVRRGPGGSRPRGNYTRAYSGRYYDVWKRRSGPAPLVHVPVGLGGDSGAGTLQCDAPVVAQPLARAAKDGDSVLIATPASGTVYKPFGVAGGAGVDASGHVQRRYGSALTAVVDGLQPGMRYGLWIQGSTGAGFVASVDGRKTATVERDVDYPGQWLNAGEFTAGAGAQQLILTARKLWFLRPGMLVHDRLRQAAFTPVGSSRKLIRTDAAGAKRWCGRQVDWLEIDGK